MKRPMPARDQQNNFALLRQHILSRQDEAQAKGPGNGGQPKPKDYWRSLEELVDAPEFREFVDREYPQHAEHWDDPVERRMFLKLMGASLALAGLSGCVYQPPEKIVPYVNQPEEEVAGKALFFATAATLSGIATPLLVRSNEGRPTKAEGNPDHPNNRNADGSPGSSSTDLLAQASILGLYDPDRSQTLTYREEIRTWSAFVSEIRKALDEQRPRQGAGLRFLTETITSPTQAALLRELLVEFPQAKWHQYEPVNRDNARAGAMLAFGQPVDAVYNFDAAQRILSLEADFLSCLPGTLRHARDFAARRRITQGKQEMSRAYVVETTPTATGASADHRWSIKPSQMLSFASAVAAKVGVRVPAAGAPGINANVIDKLAADLLQHKGASLVLAGTEQPPLMHALAHAMNDILGNAGKTVVYTEPLDANPVDQTESLRELVGDIDAGKVDLLMIVGGNPAYNTPADLRLDLDRLQKVKLRAHLSLHKDETSELCHWHLNEAHYLESWGDARTPDGTVSIVQPLIEPLYDGKSALEVLAVFSQNYDRQPYDMVREYWRAQMNSLTQSSSGQVPVAAPTPALDFEAWWRKCVHDGFIPNTALAARAASLKSDWTSQIAASPPAPTGTFEIVFRADPTVYDGRFANNGWLQELPKPMSKLTWDNAALISPRTAARLQIEKNIGRKGGDIYVSTIHIDSQGRSLSNQVPVWITPGQPDDVVTIHFGYGRRKVGRVGNGQGFSAYDIRVSQSPWLATGAKVENAQADFLLAATQLHFVTEGRDILRKETLAEYLTGKHPEPEVEAPPRDETLYPNRDYKDQGLGYAWGMSIDLNSCVGCNACVVACQSENNIPVVGKEQVVRSREMHWLRVDAYFKGPADNPEGPYFMPVPCMQCENAPCESVCPVHATVHSAEGLNDMVYNRCVGTRYCSNNCPYKVRRFNFLLYQDWETPTYQLMRNPEVSVRSRGVMEKCTYCVQRIQAVKIQSETEGRAVRDGEIVTACQAVCPTQAIVFGNVNDPNSRVSKLKAEKRDYSLLAELNTRPRTTYMSALRNPNPEISE
jgi:MoCo/4Fe-4S cofactor protein with predicted Tat translocation signal